MEKDIPESKMLTVRYYLENKEFLEEMCKIEVEENKAKALEKLFQSLLNDLMTGKIRVREEVA